MDNITEICEKWNADRGILDACRLQVVAQGEHCSRVSGTCGFADKKFMASASEILEVRQW